MPGHAGIGGNNGVTHCVVQPAVNDIGLGQALISSGAHQPETAEFTLKQAPEHKAFSTVAINHIRLKLTHQALELSIKPN